MDLKKVNLLGQCFSALGMRKEAAILAFSKLKTDRQADAMFNWVEQHYKENPSEGEILDIAQTIKEQVK